LILSVYISKRSHYCPDDGLASGNLEI
jgi:hypothetical protein